MPVKTKKYNCLKKEKRKNKIINKEKKNSKKWLFLAIIFTILLGIIVGSSLAKYYSKLQGNAFAKIAHPILEVRREQSLLLTALAPKASYVFEVENYKEEEINEVEMEYYIEIISNADEAIKFELFQGENQISLKENKTDKIRLTKDEKETHTYRLEITYDEQKGNINKDISENVEIKIHSIQKV